MAKTVRQGISIQLDKQRTLRWTHAARTEFEDEAFRILGLSKDNNSGISQLLPMGWNKASIQTASIKAALRHEIPGIDDAQANEILDSYSGSIDDLGIAMQEALRMAIDPSSLAAWKQNLANLKKIQQMQADANEIRMKEALTAAETNLKSLTTSPKHTTSESVSSD